MAQLSSADQAVERFKENENRLDLFVNSTEAYITNTSPSEEVPSIRELVSDFRSRYITLSPRGEWTTATSYVLKDIVINGEFQYICLSTHVSGTFATDLADNKWGVYQGITPDTLADDDATEMIGYKSSTVKTHLDSELNFKSYFGATGDGATDDTEVFKTAVQECLSSNRSLFVPDGIYIIDDTAANLSFSSSYGLSIYGRSKFLSVLRFTGTGGLSLTSDSLNDGRFMFDNLWFQAGAVGTSPALTVTRPYAASFSHPSFSASNLIIGPNKLEESSNYFTGGIKVTNCFHPSFNTLFIRGKMQNYTSMLYGVNIDEQSTSSFLQEVKVMFASDGILSTYEEDASEGLHAINCILVYVRRGVNIDTSIQPGHKIIGTHVNSFEGGIKINSSTQSEINGCVFYKRGESEYSGYCDVEASNSTGLQITACAASLPGDQPETGDPNYNYFCKLTDCDHSNISDNTITQRHKGVLLLGTSAGNTVKDLHAIVKPTGYVPVYSESESRNYFYGNAQSSRNYRLTSTSNLVVPYGTWTSVPFSTCSSGVDTVWSSSNSSRFTIPSNNLIESCEFRAQIEWLTGNTTGRRSVRILRNGSDVIAQVDYLPANLGCQQIVSSTLNAVAGNYYELQVAHTAVDREEAETSLTLSLNSGWDSTWFFMAVQY